MARGEGRNGGVVPGEFPEFGAIFMSSKATRKECCERELLGLPSGQGPFVRRVKAGMLLFLFEFERRELHGVFQATCDGAMNIVPDAYSSSGKKFPAQVKFTKIWCCAPLVEKEFHDAIRENYFAPFKFNFGLSEKQVTRLLKLFSSKKLKVGLHPRRLEYPVQKDVDPLCHRSVVLPKNEKEERDENGSFKPAKANVWLRESFGKEIDNEGFLLEDRKDEHNEHVSLEWKKPREVFERLGHPERDNYDDQLLGATMEKEQEFGDLRGVGTDYERPMIREHSQDLIHLVSANRRQSHDAAFSETYRLTGENDHGGGLFSSIPSSRQDFQHSPEIYFPRPFDGLNSSANSQQRSDYGNITDRGDFSHSPSGAQTLADSGYHYDTDLSSLNYDGSFLHCDLDLPRLNYKYIQSPQRNSSGIEGSSPSHWSIPSSGNMPSPRYYANEYPYVSRRSANSATLKRKAYENKDSFSFTFPKPSFASAASAELKHYGRELIKEAIAPPFSPNKSPHLSFDSRRAVISHEKLGHRLLPSEGSEASVGYRERMPRDTEIYPPKTFRSDRRNKRASVFSRLTLSAEATKVDDSDDMTGNESSFDLSVSDILAMLHQSSNAWTKDKYLTHSLASSSSTKKKPTSKMNVLKDQVTGSSGINSLPACQESDVQIVSKSSTEKKMTSRKKVSEDQVTDTSDIICSIACQKAKVETTREIPFVDFKRRNKVKKSEDNPADSNQNTVSGGQQKRRRLIRPIFCHNVVAGDNLFGNNETGSKESQQVTILEHVGQEEKHVDVASCSKSDVDAIMETQHDKMAQSADQEDMHVDVANCSNSEADHIVETKLDKMAQPADQEDMHVDMASRSKSDGNEIVETQHEKIAEPAGREDMHVEVGSCSKSEADAIMKTRHNKMPEHADQEKVHMDVTSCSKFEADAIVETRHDKVPEHADQEGLHVDATSFSKFGAGQTMEIVALSSEEGCNSNEVLLTDVCISTVPSMVPSSISEMAESDESKPLQNANPESTRFQIDVEDKDVGGERGLVNAAKMNVEAGLFSGVVSNPENQVEASPNAIVQNVPSQQSVKDKTLNVEEVLLFQNSKGGFLLQDQRDQFLQELILEEHGGKVKEQMGTGFSSIVANKVDNESEVSKNKAKASQHVDVEDMPSQLSGKEETLDAEGGLLFKNDVHLLQDGHGNYYRHVDSQNMPSQLSDEEETWNAKDCLLFKNPTGAQLLQDGRGNYYKFVDIQDMPSQLSGEAGTLNTKEVLLFMNPTGGHLLRDGHGNYYQQVVLEDMPSQLSDKEETLNAKEGLLFKNHTGDHLSQDGHGNYYQQVVLEDMPSQLSDKEETLNAKEGLLFKNHTGDHLSQDGHGNYYEFMQEPVLEIRREQTEAWTLSSVTDHVNNKAFKSIGNFPISGETGSISSLVDRSMVCDTCNHQHGKGKDEDEVGKGKEEDELLLSLGSLTRKYNIYLQALDQGNPQGYLPKKV